MTTLYTTTQYSQVEGSLDMDVYALKWKGSRCNPEPSGETPIGGRAPPGASGSRADGSEVGSLPKNSFSGVRDKASHVSNMRAKASDTANHLSNVSGPQRQKGKETYKLREATVGTLNIHGKKYANGTYKYRDITTLMRKSKIAILAIQECRLNELERVKIEAMCPKIRIISNSSSTAKEGIAFIINKDLVKERQTEHKELIKDRMSRLTVKWNDEVLIDIINIYVPNNEKDKILFLKKAKHIISKIKNKENIIIMGDFNCVEDKLDRLPMTKDDNKVIEALQGMMKGNKMIDGWREANEDEKEYSYESTTGSLARIDRIYIKEKKKELYENWTTTTSANISDHDIVTVEIQKANIPYIGKGLWRMETGITEVPTFRKRTAAILLKLEAELETTLNKEPQQLWLTAKEKIKIIAKEVTKQKKKEKNRKKERITKELQRLKIVIKENTNEEIKTKTKKEISYNKHMLAEMEKGNVEKAQEAAKKSFYLKGERCTKWYFGLNKEKKDKEYIRKLMDKEGKMKSRTEEMTKIASEHHKELQKEQKETQERKRATEMIHKPVNVKLSEKSKKIMSEPTKEEEINVALRKSENNKAPGKDGIPYEFYKMWLSKKEEKEEIPDISSILEKIYNNIEEKGILNEEFSEGAMCLLYKKKEKTKIENYRPITLLNTDYKLYTKTIATKLGEIASDIIHPNQAGFVPKRSLYDSTRTTQMMIEYAEINELEGCVIALDQEKAYDKIAHDYLWKTLEKFEFPTSFIKRIQTLYEKASTSVIVNGVIPKGIEVKRGVRQGDPMSCLLYNIAIEPLACAVRSSKLKGYKIKNTSVKILISMFADDTLIYMNAKDDYKVLEKIIEIFCLASTAKFNKEKTEYLPIGPPEFRKEVIRTRSINPSWTIPEGVKIIKEGEAMRTLGTWVGNNINTYPQWEKILEHQRKTMEVWGGSRPSYKGKELILKALVQSKALFLATVNDMPEDVKQKMTRQMKDFIWDNKEKGLMKWEEIMQSKGKGGLNIPDISARMEAIHIMWLKKYLAPVGKKPDWAYLVDDIVFKYITPKPIIEERSKIDWILQSWHESESKSNRIPKVIHKMFKVARKFNTGYEARKVDYRQKLKMPVWHNFAVNKNWLWNKKAAKCLRDNHEVKDVQDLINEKRGPQTANCENSKRCEAMATNLLYQLPELIDPVRNTPRKDNLDHTPRRKEKNKKANKKKDEVLFNPDVTEKEDPRTAVRIFRTKDNYKVRRIGETEITKPAYRDQQRTNEKVEVYTDGSCTMNGMENAQCGAGIWFGEGNINNKAVNITEGNKTNQRAELIAIIEAIKQTENKNVTITTDSMTCIENITENLQKWEDKSWLEVKNSEDWKALAYLLRKKAGTTEFKWVKGHDGVEGNEQADKLADKGRTAELTYQQVKVPPNFEITGARLQTLSQKQAYKLVLRNKEITPGGTNTNKRLEHIQEEVEERWNIKPTKEAIWKNVYNKETNRKVSDFVWRIIHNRVKCGSFFRMIPKWEEKQYCYRCNEIESVHHIILRCDGNHQNGIWEKVEKLMKTLGENDWTKPSMSTILASGAIQMIGLGKKEKSIRERRLRTVVTDTMWTIWKLRNKEIFEEIELDENKWKITWSKNIEDRINLEYSALKGSNTRNWKKKMEQFMEKWGRNE
jgi:ribonuclease HI